jgi:hypothetical protein
MNKMVADEQVQFTPGPWHVDPEYRTDRDGNMDGADQVCQPNGNTVAFIATGMSEEEHHATANLVATAPELFVRLADLIDVIDAAGLLNLSNGVQLGQTSWYVKASERLELARAAVKKAVTDGNQAATQSSGINRGSAAP